jgi:hypothetical protein
MPTFFGVRNTYGVPRVAKSLSIVRNYENGDDPMFIPPGKISGTTKDSTGAALGGCVIDMFGSIDDIKYATVTSDVNGVFVFDASPLGAYYLVAYKPGAPDLAGTTQNTLKGV